MRDLIRQRRRFVGRRQEMAAYRENFAVPPEDEAHRFVFHVRGDAGVGKTTLVRQLENTAREHRALTAYVDESVNTVPEVMAAISAQFARQGHPLKSFDKLLATYRQRRHEADSAAGATPPEEGAAGEAPPSASSAFVARAGLVGLGMVPGVGAFAGAAEPERIAQAADRARAKLSARFRSHDDVDLVMSPLDALTPAFLNDVAEAAVSVPWVTWFFDTYERTGPLLDAWLRDVMIEGRYGALPANAVVTLAGQGTLDPRCWADYADLIADIPLTPFTEAEARQLMSARGVVDEQVVEVVLRLTGGLPVLVSMLAEARPATADAVGDPSGTAVERFLKWVSDEVHRSAALAAALPRRLDEDIYGAAVEDEAAGLFGWLRSLPFVADRSGRCQYHGVVRTTMLRLQRNQSPQSWRARHLRLAEAFARWQRQIEETLEGDEKWEHERWLDYRLQEAYHRLCADPEGTLREELRAYLCVYLNHMPGPWMRRWMRMLVEAGQDADITSACAWGERFLAESSMHDRVEILTLLIDQVGLRERALAVGLAIRGQARMHMDEVEEALADADQALELDADCHRAHALRGETYLSVGRYEQALEGFDRALQLAPDFTSYLSQRGEIYRRLRRYEDALADLTRALEIQPKWPWLYTDRALIYRMMRRYEEGIADSERAIELGADYAEFGRIRALRDLQRYDEALSAADRLLASTPDEWGALAERGDVYRMMDRFEDALADFDRAVEIEPSSVFVLTRRGLTYAHIGRLDDALVDFNDAVTAGPEDAWPLCNRGELLLRLGDDAAAMADLDRALTLDPYRVATLVDRATCHRLAGRYTAAIADIERATELDRRDLDGLDISLEHAMLVSRTAGLPGARERWVAFEERLAEHRELRDTPAEVAVRVVSRTALGDWSGAERLLAELLATRPYWEVADYAVRFLDDLAEAPGADRDRLAAVRVPLAELRARLEPRGATPQVS